MASIHPPPGNQHPEHRHHELTAVFEIGLAPRKDTWLAIRLLTPLRMPNVSRSESWIIRQYQKAEIRDRQFEGGDVLDREPYTSTPRSLQLTTFS